MVMATSNCRLSGVYVLLVGFFDGAAECQGGTVAIDPTFAVAPERVQRRGTRILGQMHAPGLPLTKSLIHDRFDPIFVPIVEGD